VNKAFQSATGFASSTGKKVTTQITDSNLPTEEMLLEI